MRRIWFVAVYKHNMSSCSAERSPAYHLQRSAYRTLRIVRLAFSLGILAFLWRVGHHLWSFLLVGAYNLTPGCSYGVQPSSPEPRGRRYQRQETPQIQQTKRKYREWRRVLCRYRLPHTWWLTWFTFLGPYIVFFNKNPIHFPWR